jgi:epoxide hydrolase 4
MTSSAFEPGHQFIEANGLRFHVAEVGEGPLVLFLHGFPDIWYGWRLQLPAIAAAGYRAVAPDLRGYNLSDRPEGTAAYAVETLAADVAAIVEALGETEAVVVGHDWGGVVAWYAAMYHPERVRRLAILNAPHPVAYRRELRSGSKQILRSWYAAFFQIPWLPEAGLRARDHAALRKVWASGPAPDRADRQVYREAFRQPGSITAALNYYRAAVRHGMPRARKVECPTLVLWGDRDAYLVPRLADGLEGGVPNLRVEHFADASHWLHHEIPDVVNGRLIEFLAEESRSPGDDEPML